MQAPARSDSTARSSAWASPAPRSIGIWPIAVSIGPSGLTFHRLDFARARIWRCLRAATPTASGSMLLSWLPATSTGPERGSCSRPCDLQPPPPGGDRRADGHRDAVGAGEGLRARVRGLARSFGPVRERPHLDRDIGLVAERVPAAVGRPAVEVADDAVAVAPTRRPRRRRGPPARVAFAGRGEWSASSRPSRRSVARGP